MPEGPEIRRAADKIAKAIEGERVEDIFFAFEHLKEFEGHLRGRAVKSIETRGKALLTRFSGGLSVYSHNQLYGRWYVRQRDSWPKTGRTLRFAIHTARHSALLYSASEIEVLDETGVATHPFLAKLGPDLLDPSLTPSRVLKRLHQVRFRRRRLASLLLDQGFLGGTGNYLRSEILFVARLAPNVRPTDLDDDAGRRLSRAILDVTRRSYRTGGITNDPEIVRGLRAAKEPRSRYRFFVFGRDGEPCRHCSETIERTDAGGRRLYLCPACQRADC